MTFGRTVGEWTYHDVFLLIREDFLLAAELLPFFKALPPCAILFLTERKIIPTAEFYTLVGTIGDPNIIINFFFFFFFFLRVLCQSVIAAGPNFLYGICPSAGSFSLFYLFIGHPTC
jgi:hypothetical protein